jgi:hypothetical protein
LVFTSFARIYPGFLTINTGTKLETGLNTRKLSLFEEGLIGKKEDGNSKSRYQKDGTNREINPPGG